MKLASDNETLAENKALILYILDKVDKPIENTAFYRLILTFEDMNYFYFQQFICTRKNESETSFNANLW